MTTTEQYIAVCTLFDFLDTIGIKVSRNTWNILSQDYGDLEPCEYCEMSKDDCSCRDDDGPDYSCRCSDDKCYC